MFGEKFKIWAWGNAVGAGAMASVNVGVHGIAKRGNAHLPYTVASELVCANLARAIRLPVPPSLVVDDPNGVPFHVSLNFALAGENLPPADAAALAAHSPALAAGTLLFDLWICNPDRHSGNLAFDSTLGQMMLFDHSHALFASADLDAWLTSQAAGFNLGNQCLRPHIKTATHFPMWNSRIASIPDYFIEGLIDDAVDVGLPSAKSAQCKDFLLQRRTQILGLLKANGAALPNVPVVEWQQI